MSACSTKFLVASSRWNKAVGPDVLLVRLSEVTDWEEGGRTSSQAAQRIFSKEAADGPHQVLIARREVRTAVQEVH
jgi:cancer susceptibility candidate protein 1